MNDRRREEEKERLMRELMNRKRNTVISKEGNEVVLTTGTEKPGQETEVNFGTVNASKDLLSRADDALLSLRKVLEGNQKELEQMTKESGLSNADMERFQQEIADDYGINVEEVQTRKPMDSGREFAEILEDVKGRIVGNDDALAQLTTSFRRPYVMGETPGRARNVILVTGPKGSGRHASIAAVARSMYERQLFLSDEVYTIDMSLYQSGAQAAMFLQDLYKDLQGKGSVICFENFEVGFPAFLRMVDSLVNTGKVTLSKRYVLNKGVLVENQTGLVKDAVDSLSAEGKYLVFITTKGTSAVQNAFGADFLYHVLDIVTFRALDADAVQEMCGLKRDELVARADEKLQLKVNMDPAVITWIAEHFDKTNGSDAIAEIFNNFYIGLSEAVLRQNLFAETDALITVENNVPVAHVKDETITLVRSKTSAGEIEQINKELDEIVGLQMVKDYIYSLQSHIQMQQIRKQQGMKVSDVSKHMIFTGNPGTGKTTIARLLSRYMKAIGALSNGQLVEVTRADLVAQYVGQTAPLTMNVIKSAMGGVLFIDEAYSLYRGKDDSFGLECIDTIVKAMEDNRDDLIVILAGYQREMQGFLESNSGLKSRFPNIIHFPDYTGDELLKIAVLQAKGKGYVIAEEAQPKLKDYFDEVQAINAAEAGNGRLARNVVEDAILTQSKRLVAHPEDSMEELRLEDFDFTIKVEPPKTSFLAQ